MSNTQLFLAIGIPSILVILSWLSNRQDFRDLSARMDKRFDTVDAELRYFHGKTGELDGRMNELSKRVK